VLKLRQEKSVKFERESANNRLIFSLQKMTPTGFEPVLSDVHPKVAQMLAGHSTIDLTMNLYTHLNGARLQQAIEALPIL
jgi:integrase